MFEQLMQYDNIGLFVLRLQHRHSSRRRQYNMDSVIQTDNFKFFFGGRFFIR